MIFRSAEQNTMVLFMKEHIGKMALQLHSKKIILYSVDKRLMNEKDKSINLNN